MDNPMTPRLVELVRELREWAGSCESGDGAGSFDTEADMFRRAADAISRLMAEGGGNVSSLRGALTEIAGMHCGDQPATSGHSEEIWLRIHIGKMRSVALTALQANEVKRLSNPVDDGAVERALAAFNKSINEPLMDKCERCDGKGYHHGFGEDGASPDWCEVCGGACYSIRPGDEEHAMRAALEAAEPHP